MRLSREGAAASMMEVSGLKGRVMAIAPVVAERAEEIREICRAHGVKRLDLFGSAATGEFDPERSDVDFLVTFHKGVRRGWMGEYFDLRQALEELLGRPVDLVSDHEFRNPYFRDAVEESRTPLYAD